MICPSCGANNLSDFSYCLHCGHPLDQAGQTADAMRETHDDMRLNDQGTMAMPPLDAGMAQSAPKARLRVEEGSVDEPFIGLDRPFVVFGRRQESDVVIRDSNVSRMHAQIVRDGPRLIIEDTNSSNGTIVNDERIESPRELRSGDVIRIGDAVFVFEFEGASFEESEGSTMAIDLDSPMTSIAGAPELIPPSLQRPPTPGQASPMTSLGGPPESAPPAFRQPDPLTPPPSIMDGGQTAFADSMELEDELVPPPARSSNPEPPAPARLDAPPPTNIPSAPPPLQASTLAAPDPVPSPPATPAASSSSSDAGGGSTAAELEGLRRELLSVGQDLASFSGTLGGLADRIEGLEKALDAATGDLANVADAVRGPDSAVLKELQGILDDIEKGKDGPRLDDAIKVLELLSTQPRDIDLLLKLSHQAAALEGALRIHGRVVAAAPRLKATLTRLTG